jgi:hypothetical protein
MKWIVAHHIESSIELAHMADENNEPLVFDSESDAVYYLYKIGQDTKEVMIAPKMEFL